MAVIWTDERIERVRNAWVEGLSASEIGKRLGSTRSAICGLARRLGLNSRATGGRPACPRPAAPPKAHKQVVPPVAPSPLPPASIEPPALVLEDGAHVTALTLTGRMCRWPIGHPGEKNFHFCGHTPKLGAPYCEAHARRAYQPQSTLRIRAGA